MVEVEIEVDAELDEDIKPEKSDDSEKEPVLTKVTFAELLVHRMETHKLAMEEQSTKYILSKYIENLDKGALPTSASFFTDSIPEVQSKAASSLIHKYSLSENWEQRHQIFSVVEEDVLEESLSSATTRLLLFDVQRNIDKVISALSLKDISDEETIRLLKEKISLDRMVKDLNSALGVVILPK
jgi:DNA primase